MDLETIRNRYRITGDYHTHTIYSRIGPYLHGKGRIIDNARAAARQGLSELGITDHGPTDFYGLDQRRIPQMRKDIEAAHDRCPDLKIYLGVEADIVDSINGLDVKSNDIDLYDYINAGYHYVPNCHMIENWLSFHLPYPERRRERLRRQNTNRIIRALECNDIFILTHPGDKAFIDEHAVAQACEATGTLVEINARHRHPDVEDLKIYAMYDVKFIISSDAHTPDKVGRYVRSLQLALEAGIGRERIVNIEERI